MNLSNIQTNKQFTNKIFTTIEMYKDTNYNIAKELNWIECNIFLVKSIYTFK